MDKPSAPRPVAEIIESYRQEMLRSYQRQRPAPSAPMPTQAPPKKPAETAGPAETPAVDRPADVPAAAKTPPADWMADDLLPDFQRDRARMAAAAVSEAPRPDKPPAAEEGIPFVGYLRVFVATANGAEPLQNARVIVSRKKGDTSALYASVTTDWDGFTPVMSLPSVDPERTMQPDTAFPSVRYDVRVEADGFRSAVYENIPIYGNNYVTQPALLVPLLPGESKDTVNYYSSGGPADL